MTRRNKDLLLVALGLIMAAAGLFLRLTEQQQEQLAGENAALLLEAVSQQLPAAPAEPLPDEEPEDKPQSLAVMGYDVLGTLRIPSVDIDLSVLNEWSYDLLTVAPCRYSGSIETGDLVILGHSYRTHLRPLRQVVGGGRRGTDRRGGHGPPLRGGGNGNSPGQRRQSFTLRLSPDHLHLHGGQQAPLSGPVRGSMTAPENFSAPAL